MQSKRELPVPSIDLIGDEKTKEYVKQLVDQITEQFRRMHDDLTHGLNTHNIRTAVPAAADISNGQLTLYTSGGNVYLATKVSGTIRKVQVT